MYPNHNKNPFIVGDDDEGEFVDEPIVSPLSPARRRSDWQPNTWQQPSPRPHESEAHRYSPYATEKVEEASESVNFTRVNWQDEKQPEGQENPRSTLSSAEEFRLPRSKDEEGGLGIHLSDDGQEV